MSTFRSQSRLPERPRLVPGFAPLRRDAAALQFGTEHSRAVVAEDLAPAVAAQAERLTGEFSTQQLLLDCASAGGDPAACLALLGQLQAEGLLVDAATDRAHSPRAAVEASYRVRDGGKATRIRTRDCAVSVVGSGRIAPAVATLLAAAGIGSVRLHAAGAVTMDDLGRDYTEQHLGRSRTEVTTGLVEQVAIEPNAGGPAPRRQPDLVVLADSLVPDPARLTALHAEHVAHLLVTSAAGGTVGPLVLPGRSSCLRCIDHHRSALDPQWPVLAAQLAGRTQRTEVARTASIAALAVAQTLRFLENVTTSAAPPVWNGALEIDPVVGRIRRHPRPAHPDCPCGARGSISRCFGLRVVRFGESTTAKGCVSPSNHERMQG